MKKLKRPKLCWVNNNVMFHGKAFNDSFTAIREMQTRNNQVRSEMVRARNEDLQAQIDERIKQIEELDKSEQR